MKHFFKLTILASVVTALIFGLSAFTTKNATTANAYSIQLASKSIAEGANEEWIWVLTNPAPGNGLDGTLQDVSHFSIALHAQAEAALVSAEYSFDGITWVSVSINVDRDPAIKACTTTDVLKFDVGTTGDQPTYYKAKFNQSFASNPYATSWIKTSAKAGCNMYFFTGVGGTSTN